MDRLSEMRAAAGPKVTVGLNDSYIKQFLSTDLSLAMAINNAHKRWQALNKEDGGRETFKKPEGQLIAEIEQGWCHLYPEDSRNPYVPLAAKGPWIVTMHGAVLHDNGGYGMLGLGHAPEEVLEAMSEDSVMANIMTPSLAQKRFITAMKKEVGRNRPSGCPYSSFLLMNSGSEGNSVADRLIDVHTGEIMSGKVSTSKNMEGKTVKCIALKGCFHGRTYRPALWTDACRDRYKSANVYSIQQSYQRDYCWVCDVNSVSHLQELFARAEKENVFIEAMFIESVMGEGNPGVQITPEFYKAARELTLKNEGMLLVDNIQAGLRTTGNLSIVDYPGFESLDCPDFEVYSKAINGGQYPVSCLALSGRAQQFYRHGIYGNTMTGNPRACLVASAVLDAITPELRQNIVDMGKYAVQQYEALKKNEFPDLITKVTGTGLLYSVQLNDQVFEVVAKDGAEYVLRKQGLGVIHGGHNALRFTPHFRITKAELDMQVDFVRAFLKRLTVPQYQTLMPRLNVMSNNFMTASADGEATPKTMQVDLRGHLFDESIINDVLNVIEKHEGSARVTSLRLGSSTEDPSECKVDVLPSASTTLAQLRDELSGMKGVCVN